MHAKRMSFTRRAFCAVAATAMLSIALPAFAADTVDVEAAKKEGTVVWYSSTPIDQANKIVAAFEKKYGVKVELFRASGSELLRRFNTELQAGQVAADVLTTSDPEAMGDFGERGIFTAFRPAGADHIPDYLKDPNGMYVGQRLNIVAFYTKTDILPVDKAPKTWDDLLKPEYKGQIVITDPASTVLQLYTVAMIAKDKGWQYFEKLNANGVMIVRGGQQAFDTVKRGERKVAGGTDMSYANAAKMAGEPLEVIYPEDGVFVVPAPSAVLAKAKHPNAAKLLAEFLVSEEGQQVFPESGNYAARTDIAPPPNSPKLTDMKVRPIDYSYVKAQNQATKKKFAEIFQ